MPVPGEAVAEKRLKESKLVWEVDDELWKRSEVTTRARGCCDCENDGEDESEKFIGSCRAFAFEEVLPELVLPRRPECGCHRESRRRLRGREVGDVCECASPAWCRCRFPGLLFAETKPDAESDPKAGKLSANETYCRFLHTLMLGTKSAIRIKRKQSKFIRYLSTGQWLCGCFVMFKKKNSHSHRHTPLFSF